MKANSPFPSPSGKSYTKEQLSPYFVEAVQLAKAELPDVLSERLTHGRLARNHGSYNDFYLINMWDKRQSDVLPRDHFTYCLNYWQNRRSGNPKDGELHLWLNKIRMYQNQEKILLVLDKRLPKAVPEGFTYESTDRFYSISHRFYFPADLDLFVGYIVPLFKQLVLAVRPILMDVMDDYTGPMEKEVLRQVIRERDRMPFTHPGRRTDEDLRAYNRSIAPSLRKEILKVHGHTCAECGCDLRNSGHHIDHIVPFSKGGLTTKDNLQALCPRCNLVKGNR
jgi:hypothetical protein